MRSLAFATVAVLVLTPKAQAQSERLTVIVSDLHLSEASSLDALVPFLAAMAERADGAGELVLNGDIFALGAVAEAEAGIKLESILVVQTLVLQAIASFARANRVVLVPGHDDAALLFPSVAARLEQRLPGVKVATRGLWISGDARILVEHGHQLAGDPYRWERWPSDAIDGKTSWGQRELDALYAKKAAEFPLVASFAGRVAGLKYALSIERQPQISNELLKLFLLEVSWQQFRRDLELEVEAPEWDLVATRAAGDALLLQSIPEDDPLYDAWRDSELVAESLTDAEPASLRLPGGSATSAATHGAGAYPTGACRPRGRGVPTDRELARSVLFVFLERARRALPRSLSELCGVPPTFTFMATRTFLTVASTWVLTKPARISRTRVRSGAS